MEGTSTHHPSCECKRDEYDQTTETLNLATTLHMTCMLNAEVMGLCRMQLLVALALEMTNLESSADYTVAHQDKMIDEAVAVARQLRSEMVDQPELN